MSVTDSARTAGLPAPGALLALTKPVTWFPPTFAFACGAVSAGAALDWPRLAAGLLLAGPLVCGMSQVANDLCDRHVDAINEPHRPIPSGRVAPRTARALAAAMSAAALALAAALGPWAFAATCAALAAACAYSAEPVRLKRSGWLGPGLVALSYEGLPWITGAAVIGAGAPGWPVATLAALYAAGAHGIMTLNDFKAATGDRATGVASLPVTLGPVRAARLACATMAVPQIVVVALLLHWDRPLHAATVAALLAGQAAAMPRLLADPAARAPWYAATGVTLYVAGMMAAALAVRDLGA